jgi:hypothetical protein
LTAGSVPGSGFRVEGAKGLWKEFIVPFFEGTQFFELCNLVVEASGCNYSQSMMSELVWPYAKVHYDGPISDGVFEAGLKVGALLAYR